MRRGVAAIEYALILSMIAVFSISAIQQLGVGMTGSFNRLTTQMETDSGGKHRRQLFRFVQ